MAQARIERRHSAESGFVYTASTRMIFAPKYISTRKEADRSSRDLVIMPAARWPEPTEADLAMMRDALVRAYADRRLYAETSEGLTLIYEPPVATGE